MVGEEPLAGHQVGLAVAVEVAQGHRVELAEVGLDPVGLEGPLAGGVHLLLEPGQAVVVGRADDDVVAARRR